MKHSIFKKKFGCITFIVIIILFYRLSVINVEQSIRDTNIIITPIPSATPTPGIQPLDDWEDKITIR